MKIRILTRRYGDNFGSSLQAYALQKVITKIEPNNVILDYDEYYHSIRWQIRPFIYDILFFLLKTFRLSFLFKNIYTFLVRRDVQQKKFKKFDDQLIKTEDKLKTQSQLKEACLNSDYCICGSDQIWSPFLFDENYYLTFLNGLKTRKVAYAVSLGIYDSSLCTPLMTKLISEFDSISIREYNGCCIIRELTNKDATFVLDPTLLLSKEDWKLQASNSIVDGEYILCYFLKTSNLPINSLNKLKAKTGCKIVNIQMYYYNNEIPADINLYDVGPNEFLSLISNAKYICTNSFHCTIFSYIFEKDFFVFNRFKDNEHNNQNSRIDSLLKMLNLESRRVNSEKYEFELNSICYPITNDFKKVYHQSINYLKSNLNCN